jgi:hypothetical protein
MRYGMMSITIGCAALALGACNRKPEAPEIQTTQAVQRNGEPVQLTGCLKRGVVADDTFVLLVAQKDASGGTATYELIAAPGVSFGDQVGQQVEVTGTLQGEQIASSEGAAREQAAKGTSGTATVQTKTDLDVRRVAATSLKPIGAACQP